MSDDSLYGGDSGAGNAGTDKAVDNGKPEAADAEKFKQTEGKDGTLTLEDEHGSKVTGVPKDKTADGKVDKKVEYPESVMASIPEKYRNATDPLKAWQDGMKSLEAKLREGRGEVPDTYKVNLPESAKTANVSIDEKDPRFVAFSKMAKDSGYTQEQFDAGIAAYLEGEMAGANNKAKEMEKLGKEGPTMLRETATRLERHLGAEEARSILSEITTAEAAKQLSKLAGMVGRNSQVPGNDVDGATTSDVDEVAEYRTRLKDKRMKNDKDFRRETMQMGERLKDLIGADLKARGVIGGRTSSAT